MNSINNIFVSKDKDEKYIFIKVWEQCPTACPSCKYWTSQKNSFYDINLLKNNILKVNPFFDKGFTYFLYWSNVLNLPNLDELLNTIISINKKIVIQVDITLLKSDILKMLELHKNYKNKISFLFSNNIFTDQELDKILKIMNQLKLTWLKVNFDIVLNIKKYHNKIKLFLQTFNKVGVDPIHRNIYFIDNNITGTFSQSIKIDNALKVIQGIKYEHCVMWDFFTIINNKIILSSHIELTKEWNFTFHTPLCFLTEINISNFSFSYDKLIQDFQKFQDIFIQDKKSKDIASTCYNCIKSEGYQYSL